MTRYDDLRRMREAKFAAKRAAPVTKPAAPVTKPSKGGRPRLGDHPMTPAERQRRHRARRRSKEAPR